MGTQVSGKGAAGSAVGGGGGKKKQATTKTPSVAERAKLLKADQHAEAVRGIKRALETARNNAGLHSVGGIVDKCRLLTGDELTEFLSAIPGMAVSGSKEVKALRLAEYVNQGCPDLMAEAPAKKGKAKKEKLDPATVLEQLVSFLDRVNRVGADGMVADECRRGVEFIRQCFQALPTGKKDDAEDLPTIRNVMLSEGLAVSGTKEQLAERLAVHYGLTVKTEKPKGGVLWDRVDSAETAELDMLEARIQARRAALAGRAVVDATGNVLA